MVRLCYGEPSPPVLSLRRGKEGLFFGIGEKDRVEQERTEALEKANPKRLKVGVFYTTDTEE